MSFTELIKMATCTTTLLKNTLIFRQLTEQDQEDLARCANPKSLAGGEFLAMHGQIWPYLLIVDSGVIKIHKVSAQGRALGALRLVEGDLFCSPTIIDGEPLPATLEADGFCTLFLWQEDQILPFLQKNNLALWDLSTLLLKRMRQASEMVENLAFHPVASRVARLLLKQHQKSGADHVNRELTLDEMATMVGSTPVMVCKVLSQLADQGYLKVSRTEIEFINREQLEKFIDNR